MAKQKDDRATLELEGLAKPIGRPRGAKAPLTAAEKMRAYRERKKESGIRSFEFTEEERIHIFCAVSVYSTTETKEQYDVGTEILKKLRTQR